MFTFDDILFSPRQLCLVSLAMRSIQSANIEASPIDMLDGESSVERRGTHPTSPAMINRTTPFSVVCWSFSIDTIYYTHYDIEKCNYEGKKAIMFRLRLFSFKFKLHSFCFEPKAHYAFSLDLVMRYLIIAFGIICTS
jgi:hypothetical protein